MKSAAPQQHVAVPALVTRALTEPAAFAILYDHYFPLVQKDVLYRLSDAQTADDLTSQIFERMVNDLRRYQPERAPFAAWLFGIPQNVVSDHFRTQKRLRWLSFELLRQFASS